MVDVTYGTVKLGNSVAVSTGFAETGSILTTGEANVAVTLTPPMPDTNYRVAPTVVIDEGGESLRVRRVRTKSTTQVVVNVVNNALTTKEGIVEVIAIHD